MVYSSAKSAGLKATSLLCSMQLKSRTRPVMVLPSLPHGTTSCCNARIHRVYEVNFPLFLEASLEIGAGVSGSPLRSAF